jgi:hypothetical protein
VATDGESYGHHHKYGEMALAYALRLLEQDKTVKLTNYGSFPRAVSARVRVPRSSTTPRGAACTAWSAGAPTAAATAASPAGTRRGARRCARPSTSCATRSIPLTEQEGASSSTMCGPRATPTSRWCSTAAPSPSTASSPRTPDAPLTDAERVRALELMEMQRHAQLMYTSCGWFFDDISGIETVQVIAYAARVLQLAQQLFGEQAAR